MAQYDRIYIRFRGRVLGPITQSKAEDLIRRHQITKQHELSADSVSWKPAEELFPECFSQLAEEASGGEATAEGEKASAAVMPTSVNENTWHVVINGNQQGPISDETFRSWVASAIIRADTAVWRAGMPQYAEASKVVPELFATSPQKSSPEIDENLQVVCHRLLQGRWWALAFGGCGVVFCALSLVGSCLMLLNYVARSERAPLHLAVALESVWGITTSIALLCGFILVIRYVQSLTPLNFLPSSSSVEIAMKRLNSLWVFAGIFAVCQSLILFFYFVIKLLVGLNTNSFT